jgi:outer membrane protein OmpA-like peptidoglycan-associated protein
MKNLSKLILTVLIISQNILVGQTFKNTDWCVGLGFNIIEDNNYRFEKLFDVKDSWNMAPFPARINIEKIFNYGLSLDLAFSYNTYKKNNLIQGKIANYNRNYFATDLLIKYDLNELIGETGWFNPFIAFGGGYTMISADRKVSQSDVKTPAQNMVTLNGGFGSNFWISQQLAVNVQALGKWNASNNQGSHSQYVIGVIFKFDSRDAKFGKKKKPYTQTVIQNEIMELPVVDPTPIVDTTRIVKEVIPETKDTLLEKSKEIIEKQVIVIKNANNFADEVIFELNMFTLDASGLKKINQIASVLKSDLTLKINIIGHADNSGSEEFNKVISQKRADYVKKELIKRGIDKTRFNKTVGYGSNNSLYDNKTTNKKKNRTIRFEISN